MNSTPAPPRDLAPLWHDLAQVIAGLPASPAPQRPRPSESPRRGPPGDDLPAEAPPSGPALRWALMLAAQAAGAGATAVLLMLLGLVSLGLGPARVARAASGPVVEARD